MSIDYTKHKDKRVNNSTIEHRDFFVIEERRPYEALYLRDPSLDPQLVWKCKDEQNRQDLAAPTVSIYIHTKDFWNAANAIHEHMERFETSRCGRGTR